MKSKAYSFNVSFQSKDPKSTFTGNLHSKEKEIAAETDELRTSKILCSDGTRSGEFLIMPNEDQDYGGLLVAIM